MFLSSTMWWHTWNMLLIHYLPVKCPSFPPNLEQSHLVWIFLLLMKLESRCMGQVEKSWGKGFRCQGGGWLMGHLSHWPPGHEHAGAFKGMAQIITEHGFTAVWNLPVQCPEFKCPPDNNHCCCQHILYNQPDFIEGEPLLVTACKAHGVEVMFLPKLHCELNFIEQCWGYAKHKYWEFPPSAKEADLEHNVVETHNSVPLDSTVCGG